VDERWPMCRAISPAWWLSAVATCALLETGWVLVEVGQAARVQPIVVVDGSGAGC